MGASPLSDSRGVWLVAGRSIYQKRTFRAENAQTYAISRDSTQYPPKTTRLWFKLLLMARPREFEKDRVAKAVRLPPELDERLKAVAQERGISVNTIINAAVADYLGRAPVDGPAAPDGLTLVQDCK